MYGQRRQDRMVMVLWRIEEELRAGDNKVEQGLAPPNSLTLEHLIPQAWEAHWPLDQSQDDPFAWRNEHLHKLGNLTLTAGPLNSSLSNLSWHAPCESKDKRSTLLQHSLLKLNTTVVHDYPKHFDEQAIDERGALLANLITQIWPGPPAGAPTAAENENTLEANKIAATTESEAQRRITYGPQLASRRDSEPVHFPRADRTTIHSAGVLLVQNKLFECGISNQRIMSQGIDLVVGTEGRLRPATIQVRTIEKPGRAGGKGKWARGWVFPHACPAEWLACADLSTGSAWLFTIDEARELAQQHSPQDGRRLYWYVDETVRAPARRESEMEHYRIDSVAVRWLPHGAS